MSPLNAKKLDDSAVLENIVKAIDDLKGSDIVVLDVQEVFGLSDYFVIASGRSDRHVQGIVKGIQTSMSNQKIRPLSVEGYGRGHWVLLDFDTVLVHIFYEDVRMDYNLESLWVDAKKIDCSKFINAAAA